jgi:hypothetical protein
VEGATMELKWNHTSQRLHVSTNKTVDGRNGWSDLNAALGKGRVGRALWEAGGGSQGRIPFGKYLVQRTTTGTFVWPIGSARPTGGLLAGASQIRWPIRRLHPASASLPWASLPCSLCGKAIGKHSGPL